MTAVDNSISDLVYLNPLKSFMFLFFGGEETF
jgi:hypothetical protein